MNSAAEAVLYVTSLEEMFWATVLLGATVAIHGYGMILVLHVSSSLRLRLERNQSILLGASLLVFSSWMIIMVHFAEIAVWAGFLVWKGGMPNFSTSFYFSLLEYTTVGSSYHLPLRWRLLEGMLAIVGLLTFAWSTGVLLSVARDFQERQLGLLRKKLDLPPSRFEHANVAGSDTPSQAGPPK